MSFILDALKKSEAERQNRAGAGISTTPQASQHPQVPVWAIAVIGALSLAVLGLGWAWWQSQRPAVETSRSTAAAPGGSAEDMVAAPAGGPVRNLAAVARPAGRPDGTPTEPPLDNLPPPAAAGNEPLAQAPSTPPAGANTQSQAVRAAATLPTTADLTAQGVALPEMNLDIHVFSGNKRERFVFINSSKYREGDQLRDGPRVREITSDGVVLEYQGVSFLLPRD